MAIVSTSGAWEIAVHAADGVPALDGFDFSAQPKASGSVQGSIDQALSTFDLPTSGEPYAASLTATITLDDAEEIGFYLFSAGHARLYIDGVLEGEVTVADLPGAGPGPCPANGGAVCLCQADQTIVQDKISALVGAGEHELRIEYLNLDPSESFSAEWAVGNVGRRALDLSIPEPLVNEDLEGDGEWGELQDWPLVAIHMAVLDDGRVLTYGGESGSAGNFVLNYDVWDPVTNTHTTYDIQTNTDLFCAAMVAIPGTSKVIIVGGDALPDEPFVTRGNIDNAYISWTGTTKINIFDADTGEIYEAPGGEMTYPRWYPTVVSLDSGQVVTIGGRGGNISAQAWTPEIYTYGEGWRALEGAEDRSISWYYPKVFARDDGKIIYFGGNKQVQLLDTEGNGSLETIATLPFSIGAKSASVQYEAGKALIMATDGKLWSMDYNAETPTFEEVATLPNVRLDADFTILADGKVLINGGTTTGQKGDAVFTSTIWDPSDNSLTDVADEAAARVYHSSAVMLRDGSILTSGGTTGGAEYNGQVYRPDYLYDENGQPAERPKVTDAPLNVNAGQTILIEVGDTSDIAQITFVRGQASTHSVQMSSGFFDLDYTIIDDTTIELTVPAMADGMDPGNWMLFAWNTAGAPSIAPIMRVNPDLPTDTDDANILLNGTFDVGGADALGWTQTGDAGRVAPIASDGDKALVLEGGEARQTIETEAGVVYRISLDVSLTGPYADELMRVEAFGDGATLLNRTVSVAADGSNTARVDMAFKATSDATELRLSNLVGEPVSIDNVEISQNMVTNGSFEEGGRGPGTGLPGWLNAGTGGLNRDANRATEGEGYYGFGHWTRGTEGHLLQEIPTIAGQTYTFSFTMGDPQHFNDPKVQAAVYNGTHVLASEVFSGVRNGKDFRTYSVTFTAEDDTTIIALEDMTAENTTGDAIRIDRVVVAAVDNPNLIENGSFEVGGVGLGAAPNGWTISGAGGRHASATRATDGTGYYAMGGWSDANDGVIEQTVATEVGQSYTLSFSAGQLHGVGSAAPKIRAEAISNGSIDASGTFDVARTKDGFHLTFVASADSTVIRFSDATEAAGNYDIDLDAISLIAAVNPEPLPSADGNVIANGSFTAGGTGPGAAPTDWFISGNGGRYNNGGRTWDGPMYIMGWGGNADDVLGQRVQTEPGESYTLTFEVVVGRLPTTQGIELLIEALDGDVSNLEQRVSLSGDRQMVELNFTASGDETIIRFSDATPDGVGAGYQIDLDNVSMVAGGSLTPPPVLADESFEYGTGWQLQNGAYVADLSGSDDEYMVIRNGDGAIHQTIATRPGDAYTLTFDLEELGFSEYDSVLLVEALNNTEADLSEKVTAHDDGRSVSLSFIATGLNTTIRFSDVSAGGTDGRDLKIDNVALVLDGEPTHVASAGDARKTGTAGSDRIFGDGVNTNLRGQAGEDTVVGGSGNDVVRGDGGLDLLQGGAGNDRIVADNTDTVYGGDGDDRISVGGYSRNDGVAYGGAGNDVLTGVNGWQRLYGGAGDDTLNGGGEYNTAEHDTLDGGDGNDLIISGPDTASNRNWGDILIGGAGDDTIEGGAAGDHIDGGIGNDSMSGGGWNDKFVFRDGFGVDVVAGGESGPADVDTLDLSAVTAATRTVLNADEAGTLTSGGNRITFSEIEMFDLGSANDYFSAWGRRASVEVSGGAGNDDIRGSHADDTIDAGDGNDVVRTGGGQDLVHAGAGNDTVFTSYNNNRPDRVYGEEGNDRLIGVNGEQYLSGGAGDDTLSGGSEYATADRDTLEGGDGNDMLISGMTVTPASAFWAARGDIMNGGAGNDTIEGGMANDVIDGGTGSDYITASGGDDLIIDHNGNDTVYGGAGNDTIGAANSHGVDVFYGEAGDDDIFIGNGADTAYGGDGSDVIRSNGSNYNKIAHGGEGGVDFDTLSFAAESDAADAIAVSFNSDEAGVVSIRNRLVTFSEFEAIVGTQAADSIDARLSEADLSLSGAGGDDMIFGGSGNDQINGGNGFDVAIFSGVWSDYLISQNNDVYTLADQRAASTDGTDTISNVELIRFADGDVSISDIFGIA